MVEGGKCTCICQALRNCVSSSGAQYKVIYGKGTELTVNSGGIWLIFPINCGNGFVIPGKKKCFLWTYSDCPYLNCYVIYLGGAAFTEFCKSTLVHI